jgi:hypothetical protein
MTGETVTCLPGIKLVSIRLPAKGRLQERKLDWQIGRRKLCPNGCLPSTNTVTYGETRRETSRGSTTQAYTPQRRCLCFGWCFR